jgi:hypothetical protein
LRTNELPHWNPGTVSSYEILYTLVGYFGCPCWKSTSCLAEDVDVVKIILTRLSAFGSIRVRHRKDQKRKTTDDSDLRVPFAVHKPRQNHMVCVYLLLKPSKHRQHLFMPCHAKADQNPHQNIEDNCTALCLLPWIQHPITSRPDRWYIRRCRIVRISTASIRSRETSPHNDKRWNSFDSCKCQIIPSISPSGT